MSMPLNDTDPNGESDAVLTPQVMLVILWHILSVVSHEMKLYRSLHICVSIYRWKLTETYHVFIFFNKSIKIQKIICESSMLLPFPYMWGWCRQCACTTVHTWKPEDSLRGGFSLSTMCRDFRHLYQSSYLTDPSSQGKIILYLEIIFLTKSWTVEIFLKYHF